MKHRVDILNFGLIWITLGLALAWPFELFLFSYIVLGPLHYLTEISWLDKQNYFLRSKDDRRSFVWAMIVIVIFLGIGTLLPDTDKWSVTKGLHAAVYEGADKTLAHVVRGFWVLILVAFVMSAAWVLTKNWLLRTLVIVFCLLSSLWFYEKPAMAILFGVFLPTIIHVFFFTICFMLYGSLKSKSAWGYLNIFSMGAVVLVIACTKPVMHHELAPSVLQLTIVSSFDKLNIFINRLLGFSTDQPNPYSPESLRVQSFIAFAYTYHYLNWFSKTSIIKWHQVPKKKLAFSLVLWVTSVSLFAVDFRLGFAASFALSVLHVLLEFPLNYVSIQAIFAAMMGKIFKPAQLKPVTKRMG